MWESVITSWLGAKGCNNQDVSKEAKEGWILLGRCPKVGSGGAQVKTDEVPPDEVSTPDCLRVAQKKNVKRSFIRLLFSTDNLKLVSPFSTACLKEDYQKSGHSSC